MPQIITESSPPPAKPIPLVHPGGHIASTFTERWAQQMTILCLRETLKGEALPDGMIWVRKPIDLLRPANLTVDDRAAVPHIAAPNVNDVQAYGNPRNAVTHTVDAEAVAKTQALLANDASLKSHIDLFKLTVAHMLECVDKQDSHAFGEAMKTVNQTIAIAAQEMEKILKSKHMKKSDIAESIQTAIGGTMQQSMTAHVEAMTPTQQTAFAESYAGCMADYEASLIPKDAPEHYPPAAGHAARLASGAARLAAGQKLQPGDAIPIEGLDALLKTPRGR